MNMFRWLLWRVSAQNNTYSHKQCPLWFEYNTVLSKICFIIFVPVHFVFFNLLFFLNNIILSIIFVFEIGLKLFLGLVTNKLQFNKNEKINQLYKNQALQTILTILFAGLLTWQLIGLSYLAISIACGLGLLVANANNKKAAVIVLLAFVLALAFPASMIFVPGCSYLATTCYVTSLLLVLANMIFDFVTAIKIKSYQYEKTNRFLVIGLNLCLTIPLLTMLYLANNVFALTVIFCIINICIVTYLYKIFSGSGKKTACLTETGTNNALLAGLVAVGVGLGVYSAITGDFLLISLLANFNPLVALLVISCVITAAAVFTTYSAETIDSCITAKSQGIGFSKNQVDSVASLKKIEEQEVNQHETRCCC